MFRVFGSNFTMSLKEIFENIQKREYIKTKVNLLSKNQNICIES